LLLALPVGAQAAIGRGTAHADVFLGTPADDSYWGYRDDDVLRGRGAGDHLVAGRGNDRVAGRGNDNVDGGAGEDRILAGRGDDRFWGRGGDDYVRGGRGADRLNSGTGNDTVFVSRDEGKVDSIDCGSGVDRAVIHAEDNEVNCEDVKVVS
jgi:Ca2+-binding RTX toxin-like protein